MALPNINTNRTKKKTANVDISSMMYGKIPPQVRELEEAVLGAILLEKSAFDTVTEILKPECFYVESHQMIYSATNALKGYGHTRRPRTTSGFRYQGRKSC